MTKKINSYRDLLEAKQELKAEISAQEAKIHNNKLIQFTSALSDKHSLKNSLQSTLSSIGLKDVITSPLGSLLSTYLLSNRVIRKYFIGYTIFKETVPYAFKKLKSMINEADKPSKKELE